MKFTIIADSGCDMTAKSFKSDKFNFFTVPLTITLGDKNIVDVEGLKITDLVEQMKANKGKACTACPNPDAFADQMRKGNDYQFVVTLTSVLSGTHSSAVKGAEIVMAENPKKKIHIIDSRTASSGEDLIIDELVRLIESGLEFEEIVTKIDKFRDEHKTRFIIQDVSNLVKTGRMSKVKAAIVNMTMIKPVLGDNGKGEIVLIDKCIGLKKAMIKLSDMPAEKIAEYGKDTPMIITHCLNEVQANELRDLIVAKHGATNISVRPMRGISSFYANDKGLILAF
ncbi:MAG: DegV family protein [Firmicutes bacterium]|nr:DegV family protein [Bacillota bacterium]